ncbi:MAG: S9 family peptidase [Chloroflexota bacterium]
MPTDESTEEKRRISADDLYRFHVIQDPRISPDGQHVIYGVQRVERDEEKKVSNLWLVSTEGGEPRQFTAGKHSDSMPRWSPDGSQIAFVSNREDEKQPQIYLIPSDGGEARRLTDLKGEFGDVRWSPDGAALLLQFRKKDAEAVEREEDERKEKLGIVARHITRAYFRADGRGYLPQERWHLWTVDVASGEATQLTDGEYDEGGPRWSPDGQEILFISNRSEDPDFNPHLDDVFLMPRDGGDPRKLDTPEGGKHSPSFSPDGEWISYVSAEGKGNWWKNEGLWVLPAGGSDVARNLTEAHDMHVSSSTLGDVFNPPFSTPAWDADGDTIYAQVSRHGRTQLKAVSLQGELGDVGPGEGSVSAVSFDDERQKMAYVWSHFRDPGQLWVLDVDGGERRQLTHLNEDWLAELDLDEIEEVWFKGVADNDLQGWILKPPGFDPQRQYPSILEIHGGPWAQYGDLFMHEFYYLAAQGYVVYFSNPRGGQGYGEAHSKAIEHDWGNADYKDLMAWADYVQAQPYIDPERMGVTGGSYGGYMTLWIIGQTGRFEAAVAQRVVSNGVSFWGSSDVGWLFADTWADDQPPWENLQAYWDQSPMKYMGNVTTPTLLIHSEQDMRCHPEQGIQAFVALKQRGIDTELVLFPDEPHGLSRMGRTDRRVVRLEHILRWFEEYIG